MKKFIGQHIILITVLIVVAVAMINIISSISKLFKADQQAIKVNRLVSENVIAERSEYIHQDSLAMMENYKRGAHAALNTMMLLNLELLLKNERRTFAEMSITVCSRLRVKPDSAWLDTTHKEKVQQRAR